MDSTPQQQFALTLTLNINNISPLNVINAQGTESINQAFNWQIEVHSTDLTLTAEQIIKQPASLHFKTQGQANHFSGYILSVKTLQVTDQYIRYRLELGPKLSLLKLHTHHRAYADISLPELIKRLLSAYDIKFNLQLTEDYQLIPILHQYNESDFNFLSRYLERFGVYYYFNQNKANTLTFTDHHSTHSKASYSEIPYFNHRTLKMAAIVPHLHEFTPIKSLCPQKIKLHSYQPRAAECFATASHTIDNHGIGESSEYCEAVQSQDDLKKIAKLRAQEIYTQHHYFTAESSLLSLKPGYLYTLSNHPQSKYNQDYLLCEVHHHIQQNLKDNPLTDNSPETARYHNQLVFRQSNKQYRPPLLTPIPRIQGIVHAKVAHSTAINPLDQQGWYQVKLGFNHQDTAWAVRKSESYAGKNHGMHFPLQAGTEVLLSFVQGHPESPIITGSGFNSQDINLVTENNPYDHSIRTARNTEMTLSDHPQHAHIRLKQPGYKQYIKQQSKSKNKPKATQESGNTITDKQITKDEAQVGEGFGNWKYELIHGSFDNSNPDQTQNDYATYLEETPLKLHIFGGPNSKINENKKMGPGPNNLYQRSNTLITDPASAPDATDPSNLFTNVDPNKYNDEFLAVQDVVASYADLYKDYVKSEEIYGKKYELMSGDSTSVHKGNSNHKHHGNSSSEKSGDESHEKNHTKHVHQDNNHLTKSKSELCGNENACVVGTKTTIHTGLDSQTTAGLYQRNYLGIYNTMRLVSNDNIVKKKDNCVSKSDFVVLKKEIAADQKAVTVGNFNQTVGDLTRQLGSLQDTALNTMQIISNQQQTILQRVDNTQNEVRQGLSQAKTLANASMIASTLAAFKSVITVFS